MKYFITSAIIHKIFYNKYLRASRLNFVYNIFMYKNYLYLHNYIINSYNFSTVELSAPIDVTALTQFQAVSSCLSRFSLVQKTQFSYRTLSI